MSRAAALLMAASLLAAACEQNGTPVGTPTGVAPPPGSATDRGVPALGLSLVPGDVQQPDLSTNAFDLAGLDQAGFDQATSDATVLPAVALVVTVQPANARSGVANSATITVAAQDALGNLVPTFAGSIAVTLAGGTAGALASGTQPVLASGGTASWSDLRVDRIGRSYTLRFSASGVSDAVSAPFDVDGSMLRFARVPDCVAQQYCWSGASVGDMTTRVVVSDSTGAVDVFATTAVTISLTDELGGSSIELQQAHLQDGVLELPTLPLLPWGRHRLVASSTDYATGSSDVFRIRYSEVHFITQPSAAPAGSTWNPPVQIEVTDALGERDGLVEEVYDLGSLGSQESSCYLMLGYLDATVSAGLVTIDKVPAVIPLQGCRFLVDNFMSSKSDPFDIQLGAANGLGVGGMFVARGEPSYFRSWITAVGNGDRTDDGVSIVLTPGAAAAPQFPSAITLNTTNGEASFGPYVFPDTRGFALTASTAGLPPATTNVLVGAWGDLGFPHGHGGTVLAADSQSGSTVLAVKSGAYTLVTSVDGGWTWKPSSIDAPTTAAIAPSNSSVGYVSDSAQLWRTDDAGDTWTMVQSARSWNAKFILVDPSDSLVVIVAGDGLWRSVDGGASFASPSGATVTRLARSPSAPNVLYAVTQVGFMMSVDGGATWSATYVGFNGSSLSDVCVDAANPDRLYAGGPALYRSDDAGLSWSVVANPGYPGVGTITCDPQAAGVVYSQSRRKAYTNGGQTAVDWGDSSTPSFGTMFIVRGSPNVMYALGRKTVTGGY